MSKIKTLINPDWEHGEWPQDRCYHPEDEIITYKGKMTCNQCGMELIR